MFVRKTAVSRLGLSAMVLFVVAFLTTIGEAKDRYTPDHSITTLVKISRLLADVRALYPVTSLHVELAQLQTNAAIGTGLDAAVGALLKLHRELRRLLRDQVKQAYDKGILHERWDELLQLLSSAYFSFDSLRRIYPHDRGSVHSFIADALRAVVESGKLVKIDTFE